MTEPKKTAKEAILERMQHLNASEVTSVHKAELRTLEWVKELLDAEQSAPQPEEQCTQPDWADRFMAALKALKWPLAAPTKLHSTEVRMHQVSHSPEWMTAEVSSKQTESSVRVCDLLLLAQAHIQARGAGCEDVPEVQTPATQQAKVLARLGAVWAKRPELRLVQLILNVTEDQGAYFWSDERLLKQIARIFDHEPQEGK